MLVTGAGGFIGSHLTERLLASGSKVRALVHYNSRNHKGHLDGCEHPDLEVISGDVCDAHLMRSLVDGCAYVFHLAALIAIPYSYHAPASYVGVNVGGTLNLLHASQDLGVKRFLQTSTSEVYGSAQFVPMSEGHPLRPQSPYAATKVGADQLAASFFYSFGTPVTIVRPFNTYGPRQSLRAVLPTVCLQALRSHRLQLGNINSTRDLTFVDDTCAGFLHAATSPKALGETINLGLGKSYSVEEIVQMVARILGKELTIEVDAQRLRPAASEVDRLLSDNRKAGELLDWEPSIGIEQGLESMLAWLRDNQGQNASSYAL